MAVPISRVVSTTNNIARELDEIYKDLHELDFISIEPKTLEKKESPQKEKQISVDPISLRESSMGEISFNLMLPLINNPTTLVPAKHKFLSCSLPNSAASSPRFCSILSRKALENESQASPRQVEKLVNKHPCAAQYHQSLLKKNQFWKKSKTCGEARTCAPPDELNDLWLSDTNAQQYKHKHHGHGSLTFNANINNGGGSKSTEKIEGDEVDFKCSALCLFIPGFSKAKSVRPRKVEAMVMGNNLISRTVSPEKFECGSWAPSSIIADCDEDGDSMNLYFDLPLELIKNIGNDANLPVSAAFVFDNKDLKGVLKNGPTPTKATGRKSHESSCHVRFSTSSPTSCPASPASCITPRLRKAREDFNAFLEAQSA